MGNYPHPPPSPTKNFGSPRLRSSGKRCIAPADWTGKSAKYLGYCPLRDPIDQISRMPYNQKNF